MKEQIERAKHGDQEALSALYEQTYNEVYYTVKSMIKEEDMVFDILQDTYIKAFAHLDTFQGERFGAWVRQIAANTARDHLKKKRPLLFSELSDEGETPVEELIEDEHPDHLPEQVIDQEETTRLVREILDDLPEDQRAAIGMYYWEEMSVKEIAQAMGATENAVKSRLLYGRRKIEKKVLELEKRGTKLYGLAPIPFLLWLLRGQGEVVPNGQIFQNVMAASSEKTLGAAAAGVAAKTAAGFSGAKIALITVLSVVILGAGTFSAVHLLNQKEPEETPVVQEQAPTHELPAAEKPSHDLPQQESEQAPRVEKPEKPEKEESTESQAAPDIEAEESNAEVAPSGDWAAQEEAAGRIVLTGYIDTYDYDETVELQDFPDYNGWNSQLYRIITLDTPITLTAQAVDGLQTGTVRLILVNDAGIPSSYDGGPITFSISTDTLWWPSDTRMPVGQPGTKDVHVMEP